MESINDINVDVDNGYFFVMYITNQITESYNDSIASIDEFEESVISNGYDTQYKAQVLNAIITTIWYINNMMESYPEIFDVNTSDTLLPESVVTLLMELDYTSMSIVKGSQSIGKSDGPNITSNITKGYYNSMTLVKSTKSINNTMESVLNALHYLYSTISNQNDEYHNSNVVLDTNDILSLTNKFAESTRLIIKLCTGNETSDMEQRYNYL